MRKQRNQWSKVNKCVICGARLRFVQSNFPDAKQGEGERYCEHKHERFSVWGIWIEAEKTWTVRFVMPK